MPGITATIRMKQGTRRFRGELAALFALGLPMALTQLTQYSIQTIDVLMIGRLGPQALGGAALGLVFFFGIMLIGMGPAMAISPLVSQAVGAAGRDPARLTAARITVRMSLWLTVLMFPLMLAACFATAPLARLLGQPPSLTAIAGPYVLALAPGLPFMIGVMALRNVCAAFGRTRMPLIFIVLTTFVNAGLNAVLIFGMFGVPRLEVVGAGLASSASHAIGFFLLLRYVCRDPQIRPLHVLDEWYRPHWASLREIVALGLPITLALAFEMMLFNAAVLVMGRIGVAEVAAYQIGINVAAMGYMAAFGMSLAGGTRVGLAVGSGDAAGVRLAAWVSLVGCVLTILAFAIPIRLLPEPIANLYVGGDGVDADAVHGLVLKFLPLVTTFAVFDALQVAAHQALRGLKDVRVPMLLAGFSFWAIGFPLAAWLALATPVGARGVWWGLLAGLAVAALLLGVRLRWLLRRDWSAGGGQLHRRRLGGRVVAITLPILVLMVAAASLVTDYERRQRPTLVVGQWPAQAVVFTGQFNRVDYALNLLERGAIDRLFVSGVNPGAGLTPERFAQQFALSDTLRAALANGHLVLGTRAKNTLENADETLCWLRSTGASGPILLVTSQRHMARASLALEAATGRPVWRYVVPGDAARAATADFHDPEFQKYLATWPLAWGVQTVRRALADPCEAP